MQADIIVKETSGKNAFLKFQIGRMENRPARYATYAGGKLVGYHRGNGKPDSPVEVSVFRLLGWGATLPQAKAMAGVN